MPAKSLKPFMLRCAAPELHQEPQSAWYYVDRDSVEVFVRRPPGEVLSVKLTRGRLAKMLAQIAEDNS